MFDRIIVCEILLARGAFDELKDGFDELRPWATCLKFWAALMHKYNLQIYYTHFNYFQRRNGGLGLIENSSMHKSTEQGGTNRKC